MVRQGIFIVFIPISEKSINCKVLTKRPFFKYYSEIEREKFQ